MKILGLVTEYNPFHNGHLYHLNTSKEVTGSTHTIAVMSGNFLQRGEPAIVDKWKRAKMAVNAGVDLVIEIPTVYACATAELFSFGSIGLLNNLGVVDCISFGSECGSIDLLSDIAATLSVSNEQYETILKKFVNIGHTFPIARSLAMIQYFKEIKGYDNDHIQLITDVLKNPNNILGIEYLKTLLKLNSNIKPYTINRKSAHYHNKHISDDSIASATAIREHLYNNKSLEDLKRVMPPRSFEDLSCSISDGIAPIFSTHFEQAILTILRRSTVDEIKNVFDVVEGLENRIYECANKSTSVIELALCIKSKRYTMTRIQRILIHTLLGIQKEDIHLFNNSGGSQYARVLAFNENGREILQKCKIASSIPIITNLKNYIPENNVAKKMLQIDIKSTNIYSLAHRSNLKIQGQLDYLISPYYLK